MPSASGNPVLAYADHGMINAVADGIQAAARGKTFGWWDLTHGLARIW